MIYAADVDAMGGKSQHDIAAVEGMGGKSWHDIHCCCEVMSGKS